MFDLEMRTHKRGSNYLFAERVKLPERLHLFEPMTQTWFRRTWPELENPWRDAVLDVERLCRIVGVGNLTEADA